MKVIIFGGRDFLDRRWAHDRLDVVHAAIGITFVIEGGAGGADRIGRSWAIIHDVPYRTVRADWETHGKRAGYLRNVAMADLKPDFVIGMPGGVGTQMMIDIARARQIPRIYLKRVEV